MAPVDQGARSICVPDGGSSLCGFLRSALRDDGWTIADESVARYRLSVDSSYEGTVLFSSSRFYSFHVSVVDTVNGQDVVSLSGHATNKIVVEKLLAALRPETK